MAVNSEIQSQAERRLAGIVMGEGDSIMSSGLVYCVVVTGGVVRVMIDDDRYDLARVMDSDLPGLVEHELMQLEGVSRVVVKPKPKSICIGEPVAGVKHVIGVHSVKGGVGKSTVTACLALAFARRGLRTGIVDADVYGPSVPLMFGVSEESEVDAATNKMNPIEVAGIKLMSVGMILPDDEPLIWRGNLVDEGMPQLFREVNWGQLDVLLIDMPPGTGDVPIAIARHVPLAGIITVTSPSILSTTDVRRGLEFFADVKVPLLGIIENMGLYQCDCGESIALFGSGAGSGLAEELGVDMLARLPFESAIVEASEQAGGLPETAGTLFDGAMQRVAMQLASMLDVEKEKVH